MSKFHAIPTIVDGIRFDSKAEAARYYELKLLEAAGMIDGLKVHPRYIIWQSGKDKIEYESDFEYHENGLIVCEDTKGGKATQTDVFKLKAKLFRATHPEIDFRILER